MPTDKEKVTRKLRAILSADVMGYSLLMANDEAYTIKKLEAYRDSMSDLIRSHSGRVVDAVGDNLLAEFSSVVDAVQCSVEIQKDLQQKNADLPTDKRLEFRIGVNIGDVIQEGDRIYGNGVNVAARIEALAESGGICISRNAYSHVRDKLELGYEYLGEHDVKNIKRPVRVYKVLMDPKDAGKLIGEKSSPSRKGWPWLAVATVALLIGIIVWLFYYEKLPPIKAASVENMAYPLPDKPSIAVLPFTNMSGDPAQEYLSDGITESIITSVSKIHNLFVIARNSTFTYKGKAVKIQQVAEDLGVQYVLEGSVQRSGDRLRITAQLIDALSGRHVWSERYDQELKDLFALQDNITMEVLTAMRVKLTEGAQALRAKRPRNIEAALKAYEAHGYVLRFNPEANVMAKNLSEEVVALDPGWGESYYILSEAHMMDVWLGTTKSPKESIEKAIELSEKAISLDESLAQALGLLGYLYGMKREYNKSVTYGEEAVEKDPNGADVHAWLGNCLNFAARPQEAIPYYKKAMRLNPRPQLWYYIQLGQSYRMLGRYEEAVAQLKKSLALSPNSFPSYVHLIFTYAEMGRDDEARAAAVELIRINPKFSVEKYAKALPYKDRDYCKRWGEALRKAGLPDNPPLPIPDKPSIAVLAFDNLSGDPEQEYFSDGITEEIISALSKTDQLFVIARNSSFVYKGKPVNVKHVSRELGIRYVLEGSVRKTENRVRVTAQLIDATTGHHLWSERYDRNINEIFVLQDEITMKIVTALQVRLTEGEQARMWAKKYETLDIMLKSMELLSLWREGTKESHIRHGQLSQELIDMAPESPIGYRVLGWHYWYLTLAQKSPRESIAKAFKLAQKAVSMDDSDALTHGLLGNIYLWMRKYDKAIAAGKRSIELDPNGAQVHGLLGQTLSYANRPDEAIRYIKQGIRLNPYPAYWYYKALGRCYRQKGLYEQALTEYQKALQITPDAQIGLSLAVIYVLLDRQEEAKAAAKRLLEIFPNFSVAVASKTWPYKNKAELKLMANSLRKAGLPEYPPGKKTPEKPSIAVLPFDNLSDDPEQEYFIDGIAEDIITALSKSDQLFVIARNSSFTYKGKPVKIKQVAEELGVRYVLEGSVRKTQDRVRITAQLIDATTEHHLWAERYDRDLKDIFALQDEITMKIVGSLQITLTSGEQSRMRERQYKTLEGQMKFSELLSAWNEGTEEGRIRHGQLSQELIELEPNSPAGYSSLGWNYNNLAKLGISPRESLGKAYKYAQKAISLDESNPFSYALLNAVYLLMREYEKAIVAGGRSIELDPNGAFSHLILGETLGYAGMPDKALYHIKKAIRLQPHPQWYYYYHLGRTYWLKGHYENALKEFRKTLHLIPDVWYIHYHLSVTYAALDRPEEAETAAKKAMEMKPNISVSFVSKISRFRNQEYTQYYIDAMRKAGFPE